MLTDLDCRKAKCPEGRRRARLTDANGLYLEVAPSGSRRWFWKFYPDGKESRLALGSYPEVTLKQARVARDEARKVREAGTNPVQKRKADSIVRAMSQATTFESVAREFHRTKAGSWSPQYASRWIERMEKDLFPFIGSLPLVDVSAPLLLHTLQRIEARGALESAHTLRQTAGQVFRYGVVTGRCERDPAPDLRGALKPIVVRHMSAIVEPVKVGELMRSIDNYAGSPTTRAALVLSALLFQRPGNIRAMAWDEIDLDRALWTIPAAKMKRKLHGKLNGRPHFVPLAPQAVAVLKDLYPVTGPDGYVFPGLHNHQRPMSENTVNLALRRMGYTAEEMVAHGFRSLARTVIVEQTRISADVIEAQLAHGKSGPLGAAYDRAEFMTQRRQMMISWADYLDRLRVGGKVVAFQAA